MTMAMLQDPITQSPLPIIMEDGTPKAVVIDIEKFDLITKLLGVLNEEDIKEAVLLSQSDVGKMAIDKGMLAIKQGKIKPWRQAIEKI